MVPILEAAPDYVEQKFGTKLPLRLRVFRDREEPSCAELVVEIVTGGIGSEAWDAADTRLRRLHEQWLVTLPRDVTRSILFVTEPV